MVNVQHAVLPHTCARVPGCLFLWLCGSANVLHDIFIPLQLSCLIASLLSANIEACRLRRKQAFGLFLNLHIHFIPQHTLIPLSPGVKGLVHC